MSKTKNGLHEGLVLHEGLLDHESIDLDKMTIPRMSRARGRREVAEKTFRGLKPTRRPRRKKGESVYVRLPKGNRSKWVTKLVLPIYLEGGRDRSDNEEENPTTAKKTDIRPKSRYAKKMAVLTTSGYKRRCTVKFRYTKPNEVVSGSRKIAKYAGVRGNMNTGQYNTGRKGCLQLPMHWVSSGIVRSSLS